MTLKVLDLFSGLDGWGAGFRARGHNVVSLDLNPKFGSDFQLDILNVNGLGKWDVILASPPCETFSVMSIGHYWGPNREPKNDKARLGLAIMQKTFDLIDAAKPTNYVIENPRGMMRKKAPRVPDVTTWYCRWGMPYAKPTDLWTNLGGDWPVCHNGNPDHDAQSRYHEVRKALGQDGGVQTFKRRPNGRIDSRYIRDALYSKDRAAARGMNSSTSAPGIGRRNSPATTDLGNGQEDYERAIARVGHPDYCRHMSGGCSDCLSDDFVRSEGVNE